ncbi:phage DNA ejection protein [Proteus mirabilis]|uniref:phage DNA ejection protein n=1 Tax=Proteus mirabilis TaxID=584 RepID=UPI0036952B5A
MATWNQNINSGGFLGGIGQVNDNAPRASDANSTLAMIRENNNLQRSGANNLGLQAMQGLAGIGEIYQQQKQQDRLKEFQSKWGQAYADGDRTAMRQLMAAYPEQAEKITGGMKGISDDIRDSIGNIASGYRLAVASGKVENFARENADEMRRLGIDPHYAYEQAQKDPKAAMELADYIGMSALGMDKYYDVRDKMEGRSIDRDKLSETVRSNQASEALTREGHQIQIRGQNISRANALTSAYAPTSAMQNYSQYVQMLKTDPEGAKEFAQAAGIKPSERKLFKVEEAPDGGIIKYYSNGDEERGSINQPVKMDGMGQPISINQANRIMEKSTGEQRKAAGFAFRVRNGIDTANALVESGKVSPQRAAAINSALRDGTFARMALSGDEQSYIASMQDAVLAILRKESGAAIPDFEMERYFRTYTPQLGDEKAAVKTKSRLLENQFKAIRAESGKAFDAMMVINSGYETPPNQQTSNTNEQQQPPKTTVENQRGGQSGSIFEGTTATNPKTGQKIIFRGGQWQPI